MMSNFTTFNLILAVFIDNIIKIIEEKKANVIKAKYIKTQKNDQVKDFFEKCSFVLAESSDSEKNYTLDLNNYRPRQLEYIKVING